MPVASLSKRYFGGIVDFIIAHPKKILFFITLMIFTTPLLRNVGGAIQDLHVYHNIGQTIKSGGILYKDAIDTKNVGFFSAYMLYFLPYSLIFKTMSFYYIVQAIFLTLCYWLIAVLSYNIALFYSRKIYAFLVAALTLCFLSTMEYTFMINQSQMALLVYLFFIFYFMKTAVDRKIIHYYIYGILLAACLAVASPYLMISLVIPIVAWDPKGQKRNFVKKCLIAFLGFVSGILPVLLYFLLNDAFGDWFYWTFIFSSFKYNDMALFDKIVTTLRAMIWSTKEYTPWIKGVWAFGHYSVLDISYFFWIGAGIYYMFRPFTLNFFEKQIIAVTSVSIISRLFMTRGYLSYNLYNTPFVFLLIPIMLRLLYEHRNILSSKILEVFLCCWLIFVFTYISILGWKTPSYQPDLVFNYLVEKNIEKTPTYLTGANWGTIYSHSTRWKSIYYNIWDYQDDLFQNTVYEKTPDVVLFRTDALEHKLNAIVPLGEEFLDFIAKNYTVVPEVPYWYIRNDLYSSWDLEIPEQLKEKLKVEPIKMTMDLIDVDLYGK